MSLDPAWTTTELRALIAEIPTVSDAYGRWWATASGRTLAARIGGRTARNVTRGVRARTGRSVEPGEVIGLAIEALAPPSQLVRALLSPSVGDPAAYLGRSLINALSRELGTDWSFDIVGLSPAAAAPCLPAPVDLAFAIQAVSLALRPHTPRRLHSTLTVVVERIVDQATEGSLSRLHTRTALDEELLGLGWSADQLRTLVNAVIGARPDHARASLVAGFLTRADWRPSDSPVHRGALGNYARRMAQAELTGPRGHRMRQAA